MTLAALTPLDWLKQIAYYATAGPAAGPVAVTQAAYDAADAVDTKAANYFYPPENYPPPPAPAPLAAPETMDQLTIFGRWTPEQAIAESARKTQAQNKAFFNDLSNKLDAWSRWKTDLVWIAAGLGLFSAAALLWRKR